MKKFFQTIFFRFVVLGLLGCCLIIYTSVMFKEKEKEKEYYKKYRKDNYVRFNMALRKGQDDDIIAFWGAAKDKQALLRKLIRREMKEQERNP